MKKGEMKREKAEKIAKEGAEGFIRDLENGGIELLDYDTDEVCGRGTLYNKIYKLTMSIIEEQYILT